MKDFNERPDLTPFLIHLTKDFNTLYSILKNKKIQANTNNIKGKHEVVCFMDVPFYSLKYIITEENKDRCGAYGIIVGKPYAYKKGVRPVLYLSDEEKNELDIPKKELWRVVKFKKVENENKWISWIHEREWRCQGNFSLPTNLPINALVRSLKDVKKLQNKMKDESLTRSIIPLDIICQRLIY